jgi:3-deoxy-D-manno-octulosonic-acid transferase
MKSRWIFRLYNGLVLAALPFIWVGVMVRWRKRFARGLERWSERWGHLSPETVLRLGAKGPWWWVHAVSLGEVKAIEVFLRRIPERTGAAVLLSVVTPEALAWAVEHQVADEIIAAPIDLPWVVRRVFAIVKPQLFISVESEFWPNLLREAKRSGARVALVNGRISEHSYRSYKRIRSVLSVLWDCVDLFAVRQREDASRFVDLGVDPKRLEVAGNLKYDLPLPALAEGRGNPDPSRLTVVVGSCREGEEKELLPVLEDLRRQFSGLRVIWAPRHLDRISELESLFASQSLPWARRSGHDNGEAVHTLWDTMGDLLEAYERADIAIVGGSFVPKGGQNPLEPAALSVPVVFGPSMQNFLGIAEVLVQQGGAKQVALPELENCLQELLANPEARRLMGERARRAVESRQGASLRVLALLEQLVHA